MTEPDLTEQEKLIAALITLSTGFLAAFRWG